MIDLSSLFGQIDIYLFDQLLRGRIGPGMSVLDAGCGGGRNLVFLLRQGCEVYAVDPNPEAIRVVRSLAGQLAPQLPGSNFRVEAVESSSFPDHAADVVLSSAVLHFARDVAHFWAMLAGSWRLVKPGGLFFCRLASSIGMEHRVTPLGDRRFALPDGSERFLVDEPYLLELTSELGGRLLDPLKTTLVQDQRCMTTWVLRRAALWVADLECGHMQHVRHNPPWMNRPWVITPEGRERWLGAELDCKRCDEESGGSP
jgi:tellurite methyltransferase